MNDEKQSYILIEQESKPYEADGGRYSNLRRTFLTPDGPKAKGKP